MTTHRRGNRTTVDVVTAQALRLALLDGDVAAHRGAPRSDGPDRLVELARRDLTVLLRSLHRVQAALADRPSRVGQSAKVLLETAITRLQPDDVDERQTG